ncbi:MAG: sodium:proton antiporter [Oscillospiraceae bacterium]|nr:sodium:proton antiporter [Oscillospiraceae bacterium]
MELLFLLLFCATLIGCIAFDISILIALIIGYFIFFSYAIVKKHSVKDTVKMSIDGMLTAKNICITFMLIGMLTALWRACGTIPAIVYYSTGFMQPSIFILAVFILNCIVSILTGTSFGTAATMGVICATMAKSLGIDILWVGGAVLSGAFFGDRCSPVSTSALLVSELTGTDIYRNIKAMIKTCIIPFAITCAVYYAAGIPLKVQSGAAVDIESVFTANFEISPVVLIPAIAILVLSFFRVKTKKNMLCSIVCAIVVCIFCQGTNPADLVKIMLTGYKSQDAQLASMLNGGGITSMLKSAAIVAISSSFSGIFKGTGMLDNIKHTIENAGKKYSAFLIIIIVSIAGSMIACNQTLAIIIVYQLCSSLKENSEEFALDMENSVVVMAPLIPWSIACNVPLSSVGAPSICIITAVYLYVLPLWTLLVQGRKSKKTV